MAAKSAYVLNKSFTAYSGETIWPGMHVCFVINARTGSSTTRKIRAKGRVINTTDTRATIGVTDCEYSSVKIGDEVKVYHEDIIASCTGTSNGNVNHRFLCGCDGGSLLIGNDTFSFRVPNAYGDDEYQITICDANHFAQFFPNGQKWFCDNYDFVGKIRGSRINIYKYDCITDVTDPSNILTTIDGEYNIYATKGVYDGDIAIIKK